MGNNASNYLGKLSSKSKFSRNRNKYSKFDTKNSWLDRNCINIGVIGSRKVGKTTLINNLSPKINQIKSESKCKFQKDQPDQSNFFIDDPNFNKDIQIRIQNISSQDNNDSNQYNFISENNLEKFDILILMFENELKESDISIANQLIDMSIVVLLICNKVDLNVENNLMELSLIENETIADMKSKHDELFNLDLSFFISCKQKDKQEWNTFLKRLKDKIMLAQGSLVMDSQTPDVLCNMCLNNRIETVCKPCGHRLICIKCMQLINSEKNYECFHCLNKVTEIVIDL